MNSDNNRKEILSQLRGIFQAHKISFIPSFRGSDGIFFDFCYGLRIYFDQTILEKKRYRLCVYDLTSHIKILDSVFSGGDYYVSPRKYFVKYGFQITDADTGERIFQHEYNCKKQDVLIHIPVSTLGDNIAWFTSAYWFWLKHDCNLHVCMDSNVKKLFDVKHPEISFIKESDIRDFSFYAKYTIGIFADSTEIDCPVDYRQCRLNEYAGYILGLNEEEIGGAVACDIYDGDKTGIIPEKPYVCIATKASGMCKEWLNPYGWKQVIEFLKENGYRVIDIDRDDISGNGIYYSRIPREAEDYTGNLPLSVRASQIKNSDFFIGLGSGLSWLCWLVEKPCVLISGFSMPYSEFYTPYRVINKNICHGCFSDTRYQFNGKEYDWCPKHKGTVRHYECTIGITADQVIDKIKQIPEFKIRQKQMKEIQDENSVF